VTLLPQYETNLQIIQDDVMRMIYIRYNGGKSEIWLQRIDARVITNSGHVIDRFVTNEAGQIPTGYTFTVSGEHGTNRVEVTVTINGISYKVIDQNVFFR